MHIFRLSLIVLAAAVSAIVPSEAEQNAQRSASEPAARVQANGLTLVGRVQQISPPRLFAVEHRLAAERQVLVLVPEGSPTPSAGTVVYARGVLRRLEQAQV